MVLLLIPQFKLSNHGRIVSRALLEGKHLSCLTMKFVLCFTLLHSSAVATLARSWIKDISESIQGVPKKGTLLNSPLLEVEWLSTLRAPENFIRMDAVKIAYCLNFEWPVLSWSK